MGWLEWFGGGCLVEEDFGQLIGVQVFVDVDVLCVYCDLCKFDVLIESVLLSCLLKEIFEVLLLCDILIEDFVFYYENNGDCFGLIGMLWWIIYEYDLILKDSLVEELFD